MLEFWYDLKVRPIIHESFRCNLELHADSNIACSPASDDRRFLCGARLRAGPGRTFI